MATPQPTTTTRVVVVDPQFDDYRCLIEPARQQLLRLTLTTTGSNGLKLAPSFCDAVWMVNTRLPDMEGFDLLEMLRSLGSRFRVAVIDDRYAEQHERRALQLGAMQYVCKPVQMDWLRAWLGHDPSKGIHAGICEHTGPQPSTSATPQTH